MTIKFIHIRNHDDQFIVTGKGGRTIAFEITEDPSNPDRDRCCFSVAKCSSRENFCRKIGRAISSGRMATEKGRVFFAPRHEITYDLIVNEAQHV